MAKLKPHPKQHLLKSRKNLRLVALSKERDYLHQLELQCCNMPQDILNYEIIKVNKTNWGLFSKLPL